LRRSPASSGFASSIRRRRPPVYAVVLAGGEGTRLWPLASEDRPKPFLSLSGSQSLFRETLDRILPVVGRSRVLVVAGKGHASWVRRQAPEIPAHRIILEEIGRNTAASVALAALWIQARHSDGIMVVLPSDHWIAPAGAFRVCVARGVEAARRARRLVLLGVRVRSADAGFGYILPSKDAMMPGVLAVRRFIEKPIAARARRFAASGRYLWNSGIFIWRAGMILDELRRFSPTLIRIVARWTRRAGDTPWRVPASVMLQLPALPVDRAVLEKSSLIAVVKAEFRWSDVGNWDAYGRILPRDRRHNASIGRIVAIRSTGCVGINEGGVSVFIGVKDVAAVRAGNTILVCNRGNAQEVRDAVKRMKELERFERPRRIRA
jgi:mannose-1-phosphate guanylyltransferase/mannose-6-phosphate isomerase